MRRRAGAAQATAGSDAVIVQHGHGPLAGLVVVSLCDYSGNWPRPFNEAGHTIIQYDLKHGDDVTTMSPLGVSLDVRQRGARLWGILAAPPCTDFTISGSQWWPEKDADGRTAQSLAILDACTSIIRALRPQWWALENPVGRIPRLRPGLGKGASLVQPM